MYDAFVDFHYENFYQRVETTPTANELALEECKLTPATRLPEMFLHFMTCDLDL